MSNTDQEFMEWTAGFLTAFEGRRDRYISEVQSIEQELNVLEAQITERNKATKVLVDQHEGLRGKLQAIRYDEQNAQLTNNQEYMRRMADYLVDSKS